MADDIALVQQCGGCWYHLLDDYWGKCKTFVAGVIAIVADGKATCNILIGWCYCHCGRWYSHLMMILLWQMLLPKWQMVYPLNDGYWWLMLLPWVVDGITTCICNWCGRCYCLGGLDVIATRVDVVLADGIAKSALLQFKFWDVMQNLIPYVWQMVFANIFV